MEFGVGKAVEEENFYFESNRKKMYRSSTKTASSQLSSPSLSARYSQHQYDGKSSEVQKCVSLLSATLTHVVPILWGQASE